MLTLRQLSKTDTAIGSITAEECRLMATAMDWLATASTHWLLKYFFPKEMRGKTLPLKMLAATLGRTPEERQTLVTQIQLAMNKDK